MRPIFTLVFIPLLMSGCYAATKSTVDLVSAQQELESARAMGAPERAVYAWTMADEYMKKAKDEWGRSDYQAADKLLKEAQRWAGQAASIAKANEVAVEEEALVDEPIQDAAAPTETTAPQGVWQ